MLLSNTIVIQRVMNPGHCKIVGGEAGRCRSIQFLRAKILPRKLETGGKNAVKVCSSWNRYGNREDNRAAITKGLVF